MSTDIFGAGPELGQSIHAPTERIVELVVGQIFQQIGIDQFQSIHILHVLGDILLERLEDWSCLVRMLSEHIENFAAPESDSDWISSSHALLFKLFLRMHVGPLDSIGELLSYAKVQGVWIDTLMDKLASIEGHAGGRRMLPPEALLTLFSTLPASIRPVASFSQYQQTTLASPEVFYLSFLDDVKSSFPPLPPKSTLVEPVVITHTEPNHEEISVHTPTPNHPPSVPEVQFRGVLSQVKRNFRISDDSSDNEPEAVSSSVPTETLNLKDFAKYELFCSLLHPQAEIRDEEEKEAECSYLYRESVISSLLDYEVFSVAGSDSGLLSPTVLMMKNPLLRFGLTGQQQQPQLFQRASSLCSDCKFILDYFMSYPLLSKSSEEKGQMMDNFLFSSPLVTGVVWGDYFLFSGSLNRKSLGLELVNFTRTRLLYSLSSAATRSSGLKTVNFWLSELVDSVASRKRAVAGFDAPPSILFTFKAQPELEPLQEEKQDKRKIAFKPKPFPFRKAQNHSRVKLSLDKLRTKRPKVFLKLSLPQTIKIKIPKLAPPSAESTHSPSTVPKIRLKFPNKS